jgi:ketosteroid isomerase-like protein
VRKEPNYLYLMISLLIAVVLIISAPPLSLLGILGAFIGVLSLLVAAYILTERQRQLLLAALLGALALLPFTWISMYPEALAPRWADGIYDLTLGFWLLFTFYIGIIVFRGIMTTPRIRSNEIYGAIYVYLLIGVLFTEVYQLLRAWQPDALYFDPGRFPGPPGPGDRLYTRGVGDVLYYSFVTLATVGYGDVTPASPLARAVSLLEAVTGIMYVATMIARFVSIQTSGESRGVEPEHAEPPPYRGNHAGVTRATEGRADRMSLKDRLAIQEVIAQYSYTYDAQDAEGFAALFTEDAVWERFALDATRPETRLASRAAIRDWAAQRLRERHGQFTSRHYQSGILFDELTCNTARTRTMVLITHHGVTEAAPHPTDSGVYHDQWRKTPEGWRLAHRILRRDKSAPSL